MGELGGGNFGGDNLFLIRYWFSCGSFKVHDFAKYDFYRQKNLR